VYGSGRCYRCGQLLFNPQVQWSGDRGSYETKTWEHPMRWARGGMVESGMERTRRHRGRCGFTPEVRWRFQPRPPDISSTGTSPALADLTRAAGVNLARVGSFRHSGVKVLKSPWKKENVRGRRLTTQPVRSRNPQRPRGQLSSPSTGLFKPCLPLAHIIGCSRFVFPYCPIPDHGTCG